MFWQANFLFSWTRNLNHNIWVYNFIWSKKSKIVSESAKLKRLNSKHQAEPDILKLFFSSLHQRGYFGINILIFSREKKIKNKTVTFSSLHPTHPVTKPIVLKLYTLPCHLFLGGQHIEIQWLSRTLTKPTAIQRKGTSFYNVCLIKYFTQIYGQ